MKYKLYLDDLRYPDLHQDWRIARNYHDAVWMVKNYGLPYHISFDHDLADVHYATASDYGPMDEFMVDDNEDKSFADWMNKNEIFGCKSKPKEFTGYDFAKWFCQWVMDNDIDLTDFTYNVHSANPVGAENIRQYMANFMKDRYV